MAPATFCFCKQLTLFHVQQIHKTTTLFSSSPHAKFQRALKTEILRLRAELAATSSQDEFAKWAKLRRKLDKGVADLESSNSKAVGERAAFAKYFKATMWIATTVLPFIISSWHRKEAVFFLPNGWFGPATWFMGLPSAPIGKLVPRFEMEAKRVHADCIAGFLGPTGGIACGIWTMACKRTIGVVKDLVVDTFVPSPVPVPVAVPVTVEKLAPTKDEL